MRTTDKDASMRTRCAFEDFGCVEGTRSTLILVMLVVGIGCGSTETPRPQYAPRRPTAFSPPPPQLDLSTLTRRPVPLEPLEASDPDPNDEEDPEFEKSVVAGDAIDDAVRTVLDGSFKGAVHEWPYREGDVYEILTQVAATTTVQLEPGEEKTAPVMIGNARGWGETQYVQTGDSHGHLVRSIVFRPEKRGPDTDVTIFTNFRTLHILMRRVEPEEPYVRRVRFRMLELEREQLITQQQEREELKHVASKAVDEGCTSAQYEIEVAEGNPSWVPTMVWRTCDGDVAKVHIQFRPDVRWSKIPGLATDGGIASYRYDPKEHVMHADGVFRRAMLTLGSDKDGFERVRIRALREPQ